MTASDYRARAAEADRLADLVSYRADRERLRHQAEQLRAAARNASDPADAPAPERRSIASRLGGWLTRD